MYDFAHPIQDALEGITHSLCSLEFGPVPVGAPGGDAHAAPVLLELLRAELTDVGQALFDEALRLAVVLLKVVRAIEEPVLYNWVIEHCDLPSKPRQIEFARLGINHTVMSKRKLRQLMR